MKILLLIAGILIVVFMASIIFLLMTDATPEEFEINPSLFPYQSRFVELRNGARIHYVDEGSGPTIVLLHGNPTWSFLYRDIIAELKDDFRLVAPDYPGFGLSVAPEGYGFTAEEQAQTISEWMRQLGLKDSYLFMQDWGGPIGFSVALDNPERVKGFIIGNTWAWPLERKGQKIFSTLMGGWPGQYSSWCCNGVVRFFMSRGVATALTDDEYAQYLAPFAKRESRLPTRVFPAQLLEANEFLANIYRNLHTLADRPALMVWGLQDFAFQEPELNRFKSIFIRHKIRLLENAGHFIQEDAPQEIAAAIREWHYQQ